MRSKGTGFLVAMTRRIIAEVLTATETSVAGIGPPTNGRRRPLMLAWIGNSAPAATATNARSQIILPPLFMRIACRLPTRYLGSPSGHLSSGT